jgi:hypothetical protein
MNRQLKITFVVVALSLLASLPAEGGQRRVSRRHVRANALSAGVWGGEHVRLEVTEHGATIEYDCAHGVVEQRIIVDRAGRFNVAGTHYEEHGGPVHASDNESGYAVRLSGRVGGSLMKLTVTRAGTKKTVGTFTLVRDREAQLMKCR